VQRVLICLLGEHQIVGLDALGVFELRQRLGLLANYHQLLQRLHAIGQIVGEIDPRQGPGQCAGIHAHTGRSTIGPHPFVFGDQNLAVECALPDLFQRFEPCRRGFHGLAGERADHRLADKLLPPAFGLFIIYCHVFVAQASSITEFKYFTVGPLVEDNAGIAQQAITDQNRHTVHFLINHIVPQQNT
jgi:hypothetical protein